MNCGPSRPAERLGHSHNRSLTSRVRPFISGTSSPVLFFEPQSVGVFPEFRNSNSALSNPLLRERLRCSGRRAVGKISLQIIQGLFKEMPRHRRRRNRQNEQTQTPDPGDG